MIPTAWLDGYRRLYPPHVEPAAVGGAYQQRQARALARELNRRGDDGCRLGAMRFTFYLNGSVDISREAPNAHHAHRRS